MQRCQPVLFMAALRFGVVGLAIAALSPALRGQQPTELVLPGDSVSGANAVSSNGTVVGVSSKGLQGASSPFKYAAGVLQNLW